MSRLLLRACLLAAIAWNVKACSRREEQTCNCLEIERVMNRQREQLQTRVDELSNEKVKKNAELSACNEKFANCEDRKFDTAGRLEQESQKLELSNNKLIQKEQELNETRDKLTKCESELPTVESVRTLHHQVKQHQPLIEKKDAEMAEKDQKIRELYLKVGRLDKELAVCQTNQKALQDKIEECQSAKKHLEHEKDHQRSEKSSSRFVDQLLTLLLCGFFYVLGQQFQNIYLYYRMFRRQVYKILKRFANDQLAADQPMIENRRHDHDHHHDHDHDDDDDHGNGDGRHNGHEGADWGNNDAMPLGGDYHDPDGQDRDRMIARHHYHGPESKNNRASLNSVPAGGNFQLREGVHDPGDRQGRHINPVDGNDDLRGDQRNDMQRRQGSRARDGGSILREDGTYEIPSPGQSMSRSQQAAQTDYVGRETHPSRASQLRDNRTEPNARSSRENPIGSGQETLAPNTVVERNDAGTDSLEQEPGQEHLKEFVQVSSQAAQDFLFK